MNIRAFLCAGILLSGVQVSLSQDSNASEKEKLSADYYSLIGTDPATARKARDRYMELVNGPEAKPPFFSFVIGSQWPTPLDESKFPSHRGKFSQLEACQIMIDAGSDILKICPSKGALEAQKAPYTGSQSLDEVIQAPLYRQMLGMPFRVMLFWAHGAEGKYLQNKVMSAQDKNSLYQEFYKLTKYLLTQYNGTGKTFLIGNWEGDWLAGGYKIGHNADIPEEKLRNFRDWLDVRTRAIDDAKASTPHQNVGVYSYLEFNSVKSARTKNFKRLVNSVLPFSRVDFVSLSSYEYQGFHSWPEPKTEANLKDIVTENLDYVESMLPPRDVPGKRVFIGEIGYTWEEIAKKQNITLDQAKSEQARVALIQAKVNMEWGTPLWLWWATFSSFEGTFGLIDNTTGTPSLLCEELKTYYRWAAEFTKRYQTEHAGLPTPEIFRKAAMEQLDRQIARLQSVKSH